MDLNPEATVDQECIRILESLLQQRRRARQWEHEFKTLDDLQTFLESPAVRTLLDRDLIQYYPSCTNADIPDDAVRIAAGRVHDVETIIAAYVAGLERVTRPLLPGSSLELHAADCVASLDDESDFEHLDDAGICTCGAYKRNRQRILGT